MAFDPVSQRLTPLGSRGGSTRSLAEAEQLFRQWKGEEYGWLKARILYIAQKQGEFHGDYLAGVELSERSIIGACVNGLVRSGLIASTGEHRKSRTEAGHGRRSYVYRLTEQGRRYADAILEVSREALPVRPETVRAADVAHRPKSRRRIRRQEFALFDEGYQDTGAAIPVVPDDQDITSRRRPEPIDVPRMLADLEDWSPYDPAGERREALRSSPFLSEEQKWRLFPDGDFKREPQEGPVSWQSE